MKHHVDRIDRVIAGWMECHGHYLLRVSLAVIFIWFGALKVVGVTPEEELIRRTMFLVSPETFLPALGWWEIAIGVGLWIRPLIRGAIFLLFLLMPGTMLPLFLLPDTCFIRAPFLLTLEGQYIIKNLILITAALCVGGTVRQESKKEKRL